MCDIYAILAYFSSQHKALLMSVIGTNLFELCTIFSFLKPSFVNWIRTLSTCTLEGRMHDMLFLKEDIIIGNYFVQELSSPIPSFLSSPPHSFISVPPLPLAPSVSVFFLILNSHVNICTDLLVMLIFHKTWNIWNTWNQLQFNNVNLIVNIISYIWQ